MHENTDETDRREKSLASRVADSVIAWAITAALGGSALFLVGLSRGLDDLATTQRVVAQRLLEHDRRFAESAERDSRIEGSVDQLDQRCRAGEAALSELRWRCRGGCTASLAASGGDE